MPRWVQTNATWREGYFRMREEYDRVTVALGKPDADILVASTEVRVACRIAEVEVFASRAAHTTKAAVKLAATLSTNIEKGLLARKQRGNELAGRPPCPLDPGALPSWPQDSGPPAGRPTGAPRG